MKIVAIGGGNNSNIHKNGLPMIYEQEVIDREIISLTNKEKPNVLYISHASREGEELDSYKKIENTYGLMYHCPTKLLSINMLYDLELTNELVDWADIIYVGGGNAKQMLDLWYRSGLANKLIDVCNDKVLCGISDGAGCWFKYMCSDYLQMETGNANAPYMSLKGLGLVDLVFNPHAGYNHRMIGIKNVTEILDMSGLSLTDNMAIEIIDNDYKLIKGISSEGLEREAIISSWKDGLYNIEPVNETGLINELTNSVNKVYKKGNRH